MHLPRPTPRRLAAPLAAALLAAAPTLHATNGMNMEGYGPVATAMGGASMAFDNGTAAVINNPATLTLQGCESRLDVALGMLGPDITATAANGAKADSQATAFFMPALGYARKSGDLVWGLGVFGQGGMGCEYAEDSWRGLGYGLKNRTEVSVGRVIAPVAWRVNDKLSLAATVDFVWAGMDLQMAMPGSQFMDLVDPRQQHFGKASGTIIQTFGQIMQQMPEGTSVDYAYFDFTNSSDFTGEACGQGIGAKLGILYEATPALSFGLTYHTQTSISDLKAPGNSIAFQMTVPEMGAMPQTLVGDITVRDFEWPALLGAGMAWHATDKLLLVADVRQIYWAAVMENFNLRFVADETSSNGMFGGQNLDAQLYQQWDDQTVVQLGLAYQLSDAVTLRAGYNHGGDPIPNEFLNCLFPATVETHATAGIGWAINQKSSLDLSLTHGFEHEVTNAAGVTVSHKQTNLQLLYSHRF